MNPYPLALATDPVVPQRDELMNLDAMARRLSTITGRHGPVSIRSCHLSCVSYRPGKRVRVVYRLEVNGRELQVAAGTFRSKSRGERAFLNAKENAYCAGDFRSVAYDSELETVFCIFPHDRRITNLSAVAGAHDDLTRLINSPWATSRLVDYYPEASAVVECLEDSGQIVAYAKVNAGDEGERTYRIQEVLARSAQSSRLQIARPLAYSKQFRTLMVEPIVGESIRSLTGARLLAGLRAYGAALATLHSVPVNDGTWGIRDALGRLLHRAGGIRVVRPDAEEALVALLEDLRLRWDEASDERVFVHGDTNENNAIVQGDRVALIDFDRTSLGPAGADLGNFLGLLRYYRILDLITPQSEKARAAAFLDGYASVRPVPDRDSLRVHESAALAERAVRAVTRLRARASQQIPSLLHEARELLR